MDTCRFAASVWALKKNLDNHICWSNKDYYVHKLQQTCFCNINNLHKGLCNLRLSLGAASAGHFAGRWSSACAPLLHFSSKGLTSVFSFTSPVNGLHIFFLLDLSFHFLKLMLHCVSNSYVCFRLRFHLPWLTCSPRGLSLTVNLLAQITSWTHQINPTDLFSFSLVPSVHHPVTLLSDCRGNAAHPQQVYWWNFTQWGKEWNHL